MQANSVKNRPVFISFWFTLLAVLTGCSPVNAENNPATPPKLAENKPALTANNPRPANQSPTNKNQEETSIWVRLAKPTCH